MASTMESNILPLKGGTIIMGGIICGEVATTSTDSELWLVNKPTDDYVGMYYVTHPKYDNSIEPNSRCTSVFQVDKMSHDETEIEFSERLQNEINKSVSMLIRNGVEFREFKDFDTTSPQLLFRLMSSIRPMSSIRVKNHF